ncbi:MAG TPA: aminopeptidase [Firmicutes bacterium]|nr:aminopeptidase [Bacillota bacterium]
MMDMLKRAADVAVRVCMGIKQGETVLIVVDAPERNIGYALFDAAREAGAEAMLLEILPRAMHGEEPPPQVAELMRMVDVILAPTSRSLTHTEARRRACEEGVRVATLPGITEEVMARTLEADYYEIARRSTTLAEILTGGRSALVTSPSGTELSLDIEGRKGYADTGLYHNPGDFGNLPAGEAFLAPVEGKAEGVVVVDGSMAGVGLLEEPIRLFVEGGLVRKIEGGKEADVLRKVLEPYGDMGRNVAELGVGTNERARITGVVLEDEKVLGTVHIALGDNASMGGRVKVPVHLDGVLLRPTLEVDGRVVLKDGILKL